MAKDPFLSGKSGRIDLIEVPEMRYFMIDGAGPPEGPVYSAAIEALYALAYGARFQGKALGHDEKVGPLEGLWWADDYSAYTDGRREEWLWTMMIRAQSWLDESILDGLRDTAMAKRKKKPVTAEAISRVGLRSLTEGACLQALHVGPYSDEAPLIARMHDQEMPARGLRRRGKHHEIYLSDPRRVAPEKLKTLIRQPVAPVE
tara:strand:- start:626 stop:1234 length:609 start_codon:yes stop_codon:yes gene_type:complete